MNWDSTTTDVQLAYAQTARRSPMVYLMLAAGLTFSALAFSIDPIRHCTDHACPAWLRALAVGLGLLFVLGAGLALSLRAEWGSWIDVSRGVIVWWNGSVPSQKASIPVSRIAMVRVETRWDNDRLILRDGDGKRIDLPDICVPHPHLAWARNLARLFPHIRVETD